MILNWERDNIKGRHRNHCRLRHPNNESRQQIGALKMIPPQLSARAQGVMRFSSPPITPRALFGHASWVPSSAWQLRDNSRAIQIAERRLGTNAGPVSFFPLCHEFPSIRSQDENYGACRLFSRGVIFTRAGVSLALLSLRKMGDYS